MMLDGADWSLIPRAVQVDLQKVGAFLNQLITAMCWCDRGKLVLVKVRPQSLARHSTHMHESQFHTYTRDFQDFIQYTQMH